MSTARAATLRFLRREEGFALAAAAERGINDDDDGDEEEAPPFVDEGAAGMRAAAGSVGPGIIIAVPCSLGERKRERRKRVEARERKARERERKNKRLRAPSYS